MTVAETLEAASPSLVEVATSPVAPEHAPSAERDDRGLYLMGRPTLRQFARHVRNNAVHPPGEGTLRDEWHAANAVIRMIEKEESGLANDPHMGKMEDKYTGLLTELLRDPLIRNGFNTVPTDIAMVDLDQLVVYQKHIDLTFIEELERKLGPAPTDEEIFRICLPADHPQPPVKWTGVHRDKFVFISPSNDLRFLGVMSLAPDQITDYPPPGNLVGVIGLAVGFGSNFLNAIYSEKRLVLRNGSHRAYALRRMGIKRVPCIIQHVTSRHELELVGSSEMRGDPDLYFKNRRPPMLRDYFDTRLHKVMPVQRRWHVVTVGYDIDVNVVPAL